MLYTSGRFLESYNNYASPSCALLAATLLSQSTRPRHRTQTLRIATLTCPQNSQLTCESHSCRLMPSVSFRCCFPAFARVATPDCVLTSAVFPLRNQCGQPSSDFFYPSRLPFRSHLECLFAVPYDGVFRTRTLLTHRQ
eukprot:1837309-Pleurochrysis_carterae.AAC.1